MQNQTGFTSWDTVQKSSFYHSTVLRAYVFFVLTQHGWVILCRQMTGEDLEKLSLLDKVPILR